MSELEIPSKVTDRDFVCLPQGRTVIESDDEWRQYGKWVMLTDKDWDFVDKAWVALQPLLADGTLISLKAPTPVMKVQSTAVLCFTRPGKEDARRAAEAIRRAVDYRALLYYKVNKLTDEGVARRHGHRNVSMYMHTYLGRFYVKDQSGGWTLDTEDNDWTKASISSQFNEENYTGMEELPSNSPSLCLDLRSEFHRGVSESPSWYMTCSCYMEDEQYLAEADRVWLLSKKLLEEGVFTRIWLRTWNTSAEMSFHFSKPCNVFEGIETCDRIVREASMKHIMYFTEEGEKKYRYKYTAEGELYKVGRIFQEEFVPLTRNDP